MTAIRRLSPNLIPNSTKHHWFYVFFPRVISEELVRSDLNQLLKHSIADILTNRKDETKKQHELFIIFV